MAPFADFYTFRFDNRPRGDGTPIAYRYDPTAFTTDSRGDIAQGEMVAWDSTNRRVIRLTTVGANSGKFLGISRDSANSIKKLGNQPALALDRMSVMTTGVHLLLGSLGDTYNHGDPVFMASGTDTRTIAKSSAGGAVQVGIVFTPELTAAQAPVGAVRVPVLIDEYAAQAFGAPPIQPAF